MPRQARHDTRQKNEAGGAGLAFVDCEFLLTARGAWKRRSTDFDRLSRQGRGRYRCIPLRA